MQVRVLSGADVLDKLGDAVDELHSAVCAPVMARRPWLGAWIACYRDYLPVAVTVDADGELAAAALFAERNARIRQFVALGHGPSDIVALPARDQAAAETLATAIADHLGKLRRPWRLTVRHLPAQDRVATALAARLPRTTIAPGAVSPALRVGQSRTLRDYVSRNHHQQGRRLRNRMLRDGLDPVIAHLREPGDIMTALPELVAVCRERDIELGRRSAMDDPAAGQFFRRVVEVHAPRRSVALTTLRIDGTLAAYVLCFVDGTTFRMWNSRFHPRWSRYGAGHITHDAAVEHALASGCEVYDWGRGEEPYKFSLSNDRVRAADLYAWSGRFVEVPGRVFLGAKDLAERAERRGGVAERAVGNGRRILDRVRAP
jgi:CelD/BcsL family acetyltransferase involved in cellulose biosynthesis